MTKNVASVRIQTSRPPVLSCHVRARRPSHPEHHAVVANHFDFFAGVDLISAPAFQYSPWTNTFPAGANSSRELRRLRRSAPPCRASAWPSASEIPNSSPPSKRAERGDGGKNNRAIDAKIRAFGCRRAAASRRRAQIIPPTPNTPKLGKNVSPTKSATPRIDQREAGVVERQELQRGQRKQQTNRPGHAGENGPGMGKFHVQAEQIPAIISR